MSADDTVWVCGACGRAAETREGLADASCYLNASACTRAEYEAWRAGVVYLAERRLRFDYAEDYRVGPGTGRPYQRPAEGDSCRAADGTCDGSCERKAGGQ